MLKKVVVGAFVVISAFMTGCASVPMASPDQDMTMKKFDLPADGKSGVYVYRDSFVGQALKKSLYIDGKLIGETANKVYFFKEVEPGEHTLSTESEFSNNDLKFTAESGKNYFFEQYIKMGAFVGGANVKAVSESEGKAGVSQCKLAKSQ